ncbi:MAG: hypothetical protein J0I40_07390, partial [Cellulomonas sp.]|nr:hypothetical protein [Cellulomonas sp.]
AVPTKYEVTGDIEVDASSRNLGMLLNAFFGAVTVNQDGATTVYQQVHTLKQADFLNSYTIQQGVPRLGSTVDAFTFPGCVCTDLEVTAKSGDIANIKTSWVGRGDVSTATALATASFPASQELLTFVGANLSVGGTLTAATTTTKASMTTPIAASIQSLTLKLKNDVDSDGYNLGGAGKRSRPPAAKGASDGVISGSFVLEYTLRDLVDAYMAQGSLALLVEFAGLADMVTGQKPLLQFAIPAIKLDGDLPKGNKGDVITVSHSFTGLDPVGGAEPIQAVYRSLDTVV